MAIFLGRHVLPPGTDVSRLMRPGSRHPLGAYDPVAAFKKGAEDIVDEGLDAGKTLIQGEVDEFLGGGDGKGGAPRRPGARAIADLERGDLTQGDTITTAIGPLKVGGVAYRTIKGKEYKEFQLELPPGYGFSETVAKRVSKKGSIFYTVSYVVTPGGSSGRPINLTYQGAPWNGFVRGPSNVKVAYKPAGGKSALLFKTFGGDPEGTVIRGSNQLYTGSMGEGSAEEQVFLAAERAESAAAEASAKAGRSGGAIWEDAALALATVLVTSFNARSFSGIPAGFQKMTDKGTVDAVLGGKRPGTAYDPGQRQADEGAGGGGGNGGGPPRTSTTTTGWGVGTWVGIGAVALAGIVGVIALTRKRRAPSLSAYHRY